MRMIKWNDLQPAPWKNGLGLTREVARSPGSGSFAWRLSIADVAADGPFSRFDGLHRILTVVEGNGMKLIGPNGIVNADPGVPVHFDGAWDISCLLNDGPLRDLNLIFDPHVVESEAGVLSEEGRFPVPCNESQLVAVHCMKGTLELGHDVTLNKGDTAVLEGSSSAVRVVVGSQALVITLTRKS